MARVRGWSPKQLHLAATIIDQGQRQGATPREILSAIATGIVESRLRNLAYGHGTSAGWRQEIDTYGSVRRRRNVRGAARRYYSEARALRGRRLPPGQLAQAVQRSAYPRRYGQVLGEARKIIRAVQGSAAPDLRRESLQVRLRDGQPRVEIDLKGALVAALSSGRSDVLMNAVTLAQSGQFTRIVEDMPEMDLVPRGTRRTRRPRRGGSRRQELVRIARQAQRMGLRVGEFEPFDKVDPVHTSRSFHYRRRAMDVSGDRRALARFNRWVARNYGNRLAEMFYDPGINIDEGRRTRPIGGHGGHVHVAL